MSDQTLSWLFLLNASSGRLIDNAVKGRWQRGRLFVQVIGHSSFGQLGNERQVWHRAVNCHVSNVQAQLLQQRRHDCVLLSVGLTVLVMYGRSRSMNSRTRKVGTRSREHDMIGNVMTMRRTSAGAPGRNDDSVDVLFTIVISLSKIRDRDWS